MVVEHQKNSIFQHVGTPSLVSYLKTFHRVTEISIKQIPWCYWDFHKLQTSHGPPQCCGILTKRWFPSACCSLLGIFVFVRLISNWMFYLSPGSNQQFYISIKNKKNHHGYSTFPLRSSLLVHHHGHSLMLQAERRKDGCFNSNHVKASSCPGASSSVRQPDFRRLFEEVMQSICSVPE